VVVQLVLVGPVIEEDVVRPAAVVDAEKTDAVVVSVALKMHGGRFLCGIDQLRPRQVAVVGDPVDLDPPTFRLPEFEEADRAAVVRFDEFDHGQIRSRCQVPGSRFQVPGAEIQTGFSWYLVLILLRLSNIP
jgi:hypothetical protein